MTKVRFKGYIFVTWEGDHAPRHVHVFKDSRLVLKWNLEAKAVISGKATRALVRMIEQLESEGRL